MQSLRAPDGELVLSPRSIPMEPQSIVGDAAWLSAISEMAKAGPLITRSSVSSMEMIWRLVAVILVQSTKGSGCQGVTSFLRFRTPTLL